MPRPAKGPRTYLREREGRQSVWSIRDGETEITARDDHGNSIEGSSPESRRRAEKALGVYLGEKHTPDFSDNRPSAVQVTDTLSLYGLEVGPQTTRPELIGYDISSLTGFFAGKRVSEVTPGTCRRYVEWRTAQPNSRYKNAEDAPRVSIATARRELLTLQAALGYAWREGKLSQQVPVEKPQEAPSRDRWLTRDEAARLIAGCLGFVCAPHSDIRTREVVWAAWGRRSDKINRHAARFVLLALYTGTRHQAVLNLRWGVNSEGGWIDLDRRIIYRAGEGEKQTRKRRTPVPIAPRLCSHLRRWRDESVSHVVEWRGEPILKMRKAWDGAAGLAQLGPEITPHILRHTFATWAVQSGQSLAKIGATIGATEQMVETRYGHHAPEHLQDVVEAVSGAYLGRGLRPGSSSGLRRTAKLLKRLEK